MKSAVLRCGLTQLPYIVDGRENPELMPEELDIARAALEQMQVERHTHRLAANYSYQRLNLDKMILYSILYNAKDRKPVLATGVQKFHRQSARVFSRYFIFSEYRKGHVPVLLNKIDDFELLEREVALVSEKYPFIFWSRDKGTLFFKKLKEARPEIFGKWVVHPEKIEMLYKNNHQGFMYYNAGSDPAAQYIEQDLVYRSQPEPRP